MKRQNGFSLLELMIAITIMGVIMGYAVPSLSDFWDKKRLIAGAEAVYSELQFARSEAIARSANVSVVFKPTNDKAVWTYGTSTDATCDPDTATVGGTDPCVLVVDDGDGTVDDGSGTIDSDDLILRRFASTDFTGANMNDIGGTVDPITFAGDSVTFDFIRGTAATGSVRFESDAGKRLKIVVNALGRVKICSPSGTNKVPGYTSTDCDDW